MKNIKQAKANGGRKHQKIQINNKTIKKLK